MTLTDCLATGELTGRIISLMPLCTNIELCYFWGASATSSIEHQHALY